MPSSIHLLQSNIGMGLNHQAPLRHGFQALGAFFLARNPEFFRQNAEVESYIRYIKSCSPDIVYLTEVCGVEQRDMLCDALEAQGYRVHVEKGFELWSMQEESHRFLYHIMATRSEFTHKNTFFQHRQDKVAKYLKSRHQLSKSTPSIPDRTNAILDGSGSHYKIDGIEIGLLHAHADVSTDVVHALSGSLAEGGGGQLSTARGRYEYAGVKYGKNPFSNESQAQTSRK